MDTRLYLICYGARQEVHDHRLIGRTGEEGSGHEYLPAVPLCLEPGFELLVIFAHFSKVEVFWKVSTRGWDEAAAGHVGGANLVLFDSTILIRHPHGAACLIRNDGHDVATIQ